MYDEHERLLPRHRRSALRKSEGLQRVEAVWKRSFCVILPCQHARQGLGEPVPRYTQRWELMDFLQVVSEIAS